MNYLLFVWKVIPGSAGDPILTDALTIPRIDQGPFEAPYIGAPCPEVVVEDVPCEDISAEQCDYFDGCHVDWGPCEPTYSGYFSPPGTLSQRVCPQTYPDIEWTYGNSREPCKATCIDPRKILRDESCQWIPAGHYTQNCSKDSDIIIGECQSSDGIVFTEFNSCLAEKVATILGDRVTNDFDYMTIQVWIRINTRSLGVTGQGAHCLILGAFGKFLLGVEYQNESTCTLYAAYDDIHSESITIPHFSGFWDHLAVTFDMNSKVVNFFVNGQRIRTNMTLRIESSAVISDSLFSEVVANQYLAYLYRMHYGPFLISENQLVPGSDSILNNYLEQTSIPMVLFQINISENISSWKDLDCFRRSPSDLEPLKPFCDGNWCENDPGICYPACADGEVYDEQSCTCSGITTVLIDSTDPCALYTEVQYTQTRDLPESSSVTSSEHHLSRSSWVTENVKSVGSVQSTFPRIPSECVYPTQPMKFPDNIERKVSVPGEATLSAILGTMTLLIILYLWIRSRRRIERVMHIDQIPDSTVSQQWESQLQRNWCEFISYYPEYISRYCTGSPN